jgi:GT2 family glycosyltransferase
VELPSFSIVIPTYARPGRLCACLESLTRLEYPRERFEVIVVDDGSPVPPHGCIADLPDHLNVRLLVQSHSGPANARNTGARAATGKFIAFTDDDCVPEPDWLKELAAVFSAVPDAAIGGRTINGLPQNPFSRASQLLIDYIYCYYNAVPGRCGFFTSNNLAVPSRLFHELKGFDTWFPLAAAEDRDFCDRWQHRGHRMAYAPKAVVHHLHELKFRSFWQQHFNYGRGASLFHRARAIRRHEGIRFEPLSFYANLLRAPFARNSGGRALMICALLFVSQVANASGFCWDRFLIRQWSSA